MMSMKTRTPKYLGYKTLITKFVKKGERGLEHANQLFYLLL